MKIIDKAERTLGKFAIKNLTFWLMIGQVLLYGLDLFRVLPIERVAFYPVLFLEGQLWRIITFMFVPPEAIGHPIFLAIFWYLLYIMGTALEEKWGIFRFNIFILTGWILTVAAAFIYPAYAATNFYLVSSIYLAFAIIYPNFVVNFMFVLPLKVIWIASLVWALYLFRVFFGAPDERYMILAAVFNIMLYFGKDVLDSFKAAKRRKAFAEKAAMPADEAFHRCCICGATDKTHPQATFLYKQGRGYCDRHTPLMEKPEAEQLAAAGGAFKE